MRIFFLSVALTSALASPALAGDWRQWGGPGRDFKCDAAGLMEKWPVGGPRTLWKRELGEGYSAIVAGDGLLFTMYRSGDQEHVVALSADSGETRWTHSYDAAPLPDSELGFGKGPNSTPLLAGDRLISVGFTGKLRCLDAKTGKLLWSSDLLADHGGTFVKFGYSASPLLHDGAVILPVGAKGRGLMAFSIADGAVRWAGGDFANSYSSPILVDVGGRKLLTLVTDTQIVGCDAGDGKLLFTHPYKNQWDTHCTTPVDCGAGRVFYPSFEGGPMLKLSREGEKVRVEELWTTKRMGAGQTNVVCVGERLYGAAGSGKSGAYSGVSVADGQPAWRERVPLATSLAIGDRLLILDESGVLRLARGSGAGLETISEAPLLEAKAWTVPTLVDGRLYVRDQKHVLAVDLRSGPQ